MLKINVGLSRKVTEDYNSRGFSLNIEGELPSEVLGDQKALADSTNRLFALANLMLDEQVKRATSPEPDMHAQRASRNGNAIPANGNGRSHAQNNRDAFNGHNGNGHSNGERLLTQAQARAIGSMVRKLNQNADDWARNEFGVTRIDDLTIKQASQAIDLLKQDLEAAAKDGGR